MGFLDLVSGSQKKDPPTDKKNALNGALRGPGGKFVSKKQLEAQAFQPATAPSPEKEEPAKSNNPLMETITINESKVRKFSFEDETYYCFEDLLSAVGVTNPDEHLREFVKTDPKIQISLDNLAEVELEGKGKNQTLQFASQSQATELLKSLDKPVPEQLLSAAK